nr:hypothetical protein [Bradyrhizobium sp. 164]
MTGPVRSTTRTEADRRPVKITLGELRATGVRDLIAFCRDYRCGHSVKLPASEVDKRPDENRLSQLEPRFVCRACGQRGAILRAGSEGTMMAIGRRRPR